MIHELYLSLLIVIACIALVIQRVYLKKREKKIKLEITRLKYHRDKLPLGVIEFDENFKIISWNQAAETIFGYAKQEVINRQGAELLVPANKKNALPKLIEDIITSHHDKRHILECVNKQNESMICKWIFSPIFNEQNTI